MLFPTSSPSFPPITIISNNSIFAFSTSKGLSVIKRSPLLLYSRPSSYFITVLLSIKGIILIK